MSNNALVPNPRHVILKEHDVTLLFEAVDPVNDPHIIEYKDRHVYLLDMVNNSLEFSPCGYDELVEVANALGLEIKKRNMVLNTWDDFIALYQNSQTLLDHPDATPFEGYVIRDANEFMLKIKTDYYSTWKLLRGVSQSVFKYGHFRSTGALQTPLTNYFYAFVKKYAESNPFTNIIELRNLYYKAQCQQDEVNAHG